MLHHETGTPGKMVGFSPHTFPPRLLHMVSRSADDGNGFPEKKISREYIDDILINTVRSL